MKSGHLLLIAALLAGGVILMQRYKKTMPRGIRNNNPLNIRKSGIQWRGKVGDDGEFEVFDVAHNGIRAAARNLRTYRNTHGLRSVAGIIGRWAPPAGQNSDGTTYQQNTTAYVLSVAEKAGVEPDQVLEVSDYTAVVAAMIHHENGQQPYSLGLIEAAVQDGFA